MCVERLPDLGPAPGIDDPQIARFRLFDSHRHLPEERVRTRPLVLVMDDLHWADEGSLRLLEFVAHELSGARLLLIGTYRDVELSRRHPLSQTLAELTRERLFERLLLRGLSRDDVGRFVETTCGISSARPNSSAWSTRRPKATPSLSPSRPAARARG